VALTSAQKQVHTLADGPPRKTATSRPAAGRRPTLMSWRRLEDERQRPSWWRRPLTGGGRPSAIIWPHSNDAINGRLVCSAPLASSFRRPPLNWHSGALDSRQIISKVKARAEWLAATGARARRTGGTHLRSARRRAGLGPARERSQQTFLAIGVAPQTSTGRPARLQTAGRRARLLPVIGRHSTRPAAANANHWAQSQVRASSWSLESPYYATTVLSLSRR
jgi:hypothetical protein